MTFRKPYITPASQVKGFAPDQLHTDVSLFPNPIPFSQTDWAPVKPQFRVSQQTQTYNNLLYVAVAVAAPFSQTDWPRVVAVKPYVVDVQHTDILLYPNNIPVNNFVTNDFKLTNVKRFLPDVIYTNLNIGTVGSPLIPLDWGRQQNNPDFLPPPQYPNVALLFSLAPSPFFTRDFSTPFVPVPSKQDQRSLNINLYTNPIPFDNSVPGGMKLKNVNRFLPDVIYPNFNTNTTGNPVAPLDWGRQQNNPDFLPPPQYPNIALLFAPVIPSTPLGLFNWINQGVVKLPVILVSDQNNLPNLSLYYAPVPVPVADTPSGRQRSKWQKGVERIRLHTVQIRTVHPDIKKAAAHMASLGGHARAASLTSKARTQIATKAANTRWK